MSARIAAIAAFLANPTIDVQVRAEFTDDHVLGTVLKINDTDIALPWCGWEILAAARYVNDSPKARADLTEFLQGLRDDHSDEDLDDHTDPSTWIED